MKIFDETFVKNIKQCLTGGHENKTVDGTVEVVYTYPVLIRQVVYLWKLWVKEWHILLPILAAVIMGLLSIITALVIAFY